MTWPPSENQRAFAEVLLVYLPQFATAATYLVFFFEQESAHLAQIAQIGCPTVLGVGQFRPVLMPLPWHENFLFNEKSH